MAETKTLTSELILELKAILERQNGRVYSYEEAARIGRGVTDIFSELADNPLGIGHIKRKGGSDETQIIQP